MSLQSSISVISKALDILLEPNSVAELRLPNTHGQTMIGYFDDHSLLAKAAATLSGQAPGVYVTLNPVRPDLLSRAVNKVSRYIKNATSDADILRRRWFLIDFDPARPAGISATHDEHEAALDRARQCRNWLSAQGWPDPVLADSGNGGHLLYRLELPNELATAELVKHCIQSLGLHFSDDKVIVDLSTYNAARICKVYGTLAAKGDNTSVRPHRHATLLEVPSDLRVVSAVLLEQLAARLPPAPKRHYEKGAFDLAAWLSQHAIPVVSESQWNGGHKWILNPCPWNPEHTNKAAYVVQLPNGAIAAGCLHAGCAGNDWPALRRLFDSDQTATATGPNSHHEGDAGRELRQERPTQVKRLLSLGADVELFHTPENEAYATVPLNEHVENWSLKGRRFRQWLLGRYYRETGGSPKNQAVQEAIGIFESKANFDGPEHPVFVRFAERDGKIYLDLGNDGWEAVEIDRAGWRVVSSLPIKFRRARGMCPLPNPIRGGRIDQLRRFVNVASQQDWMLLMEWLVAAFRPHGPYPILILHGEQGSAKSTTSRVLRALLDPNLAPLRGEPRDLRDLMIAASNGWIISLDNLSRIPHWLSDALCRLATGGGFATRELYTDADEVLFDAQRPVILNAIEELATRGDLLDRALIFYLPSMPEEKRDSESNLWSEFDAIRPTVLGALLDVTSGALGRLEGVRLKKKPRMADFALWATAAEPLLGFAEGAFMDAYVGNQFSANHVVLEASPVASIIQTLARDEVFKGTATELLKVLTIRADDALRSQKSWPGNGNALSNKLRRLAPNLRKCGVDVSFSRDPNRNRDRIITIRELASASSDLSEEPNSKAANRTQEDAVDADADASESPAALVNCTGTKQLNGMADDADAGIKPFDLLPMACGERKNPRLLQPSEKRRLKGEL